MPHNANFILARVPHSLLFVSSPAEPLLPHVHTNVQMGTSVQRACAAVAAALRASEAGTNYPVRQISNRTGRFHQGGFSRTQKRMEPFSPKGFVTLAHSRPVAPHPRWGGIFDLDWI